MSPQQGDPWGEFKDEMQPQAQASGWDEFKSAESAAPAQAKPEPRAGGEAVHDGDTFRLPDGRNGRLYGVDAFELDQPGYNERGVPYPLGVNARDSFAPLVAPGASIANVAGQVTYGRPVVTVERGGQDVGETLVRDGLALPELRYLSPDNQRRAIYIAAQRDAIANERGAYRGQYQDPREYRKQGASAPMQGKTAMPTPDAAEYEALVRDPATTPEKLSAWLSERGQSAENIGNILSFLRRNPQAEAFKSYQQKDVTGAPVAPGGVGLFERFMGSVNEGIPDALGAPVDLAQMGLTPIEKLLGITPPEKPIGGSAMFRDWLHATGQGQIDERFAPRSTLERYAQAFGRGAGGAAVPGAGTVGLGSRFVGRAPSALTAGSAARSGIREALVDAGKAPGVALATEVGASMGAYGAGQLADDIDPTNPYLSLTAQIIGSLAGGVAGARTARRGVPEPTTPARAEAPQEIAPIAPDVVERDGATFVRTPRGEMALPVDPSGNPGVIWADDHWEALVGFEDGSPLYGPQGGANSLPSRYGDVARQLNADLPPRIGAPDRPEVRGERVDAPAQPMKAESGTATLLGPEEPLPTGDPAAMAVAPAVRPEIAERLEPGDLLPVPATRVGDVEEAAGIETGRYETAKAPDERAELESRSIPSPRDGTRTLPKRGPLDLVTWLRTEGGLRPEGGELAHYGITNAPRKGMDFAGGEDRFGKLVDDQNGMGYDEAADHAWEAGYFPDHAERPTITEFLDALSATHSGRNRAFHPDDLEEIDRFNSARAQRHAVEKAKDEGAPLVTDRSEPASLQDMDSNAAPVRAYEEWGENAPDFAGNIRLDGLDAPQDIKRALAQVDRAGGGFDEARRGRIAQAETAQLAEELNMTPRELLSRRKGQAFNAEEALAARQLLAKSANELVNAARSINRRIVDGDASDAELASFRQKLIRHAAIQEQVSGATAEAGRALAAFKIPANARAVRGDVLKSLVEGGGGADGIRAAAGVIIDSAESPGVLSSVVEKLAKPKFKDKAIELYYNFLLSGPRTHAVNILSNTLTSIAQIPEHGVAAIVGAARKAMPRQADTDRVLFSELGARTVGMLQGAKEGFVQGLRTFRTGETSDFVSKVEAQQQRAIPGPVGSVLRTPTRALAAEDEFFKAVARRMEINGLALRQAHKEGARGKMAELRAAQLMSNPTDEMLEKAGDYARYVTFQRSLGPTGQLGSAFLQAAWPLKLFVPFVRTPTNLLKFAAERSLLAPILKEWRTDVFAGGARRDLAVAKVLVGTGATAMALEAAANGFITGGGPADDNAKRLLEANGWQPYSVRVGDRYYSYQRLDPFSTTIGLAADYVDLQEHMTDKERDRIGAIITGSILQNLSSKSWLSGMSNLGEALSDWGRYGDNFLASLAGSTVPAVVGQAAQAIDPVQREARTALDRIRSRVPGVSKSLPARRDVFGNQLEGGNGGGVSAFSPIFSRDAKNDPTIKALIGSNISIAKPSRTIGDPDNPGQKIELTPEQYSFYQEASGQAAKPLLDDLVNGAEWGDMDLDERKAAVRQIIEDSRDGARDLVRAMARPKPRPAAIPPGVAGLPDPWMEFAGSEGR